MLLTKCLASQQCWSDAIYGGAQAALRDCLANRPCGKSDDSCYGDNTYANPAFAKFKQDCLAKREACKGATFADDVCLVPIVSTSIIDSTAACFAKDCAAATSCVNAARRMIGKCPIL